MVNKIEMKVLQTIPYFNKASGGPTSCLYNLSKGLNKNNVETDVLTFKPASNDFIGNDKFIKYQDDDRFSPLWLSKNFDYYLNHNIQNYDIIHVNTIWTWPSHSPIRKAIEANKPVVLSPHGMLYPKALEVSKWKKKLIGKLFLNSDLSKVNCLHATSEEEANHIRNYGISQPIAIISNCIDTDSYGPPRQISNKIRRFGFVGRLHPIKNIDLILEAWKNLANATNSAELIIIGDGEKDYVDSLKKFVSDNNLTNITFLGFLKGKELKEEVAKLDFQLLISKSENFGMVVPEALMAGVPVIASNGTPWKSLEHNKCGWWINPSIEDIKKTISDALNLSEHDRINMGERGRNMVKSTFGSDKIANQMKELYEWILGDKKQKPDFVI